MRHFIARGWWVRAVTGATRRRVAGHRLGAVQELETRATPSVSPVVANDDFADTDGNNPVTNRRLGQRRDCRHGR